MRVLIVDSRDEEARRLKAALAAVGIEADTITTAATADLAMKAVSYGAAILDLDIPDMDGLLFLRRMRWRSDKTPVLISSARRGLRERLGGLRAGADDYLEKPFAIAELVSCVQSLLRRPHASGGLSLGNVSIESDTGTPYVNGKRLPCTVNEEMLLEVLMRHADKAVAAERLAAVVNDPARRGKSNALQVCIHRLRGRLAEASADISIITFKGLGYGLMGTGKNDTKSEG